MTKEQKDEKKKKKKARAALLLFLKRLRKTCGTCSDVGDWYSFLKKYLDPVIDEYQKEIPHTFFSAYKDATNLTDKTNEGIQKACKNLQFQIEKVIKSLPGGLSMTSLVAGIFILLAVGAAAAAVLIPFPAATITIKNKGCDTIKPPVWFFPVNLPAVSLPTHSIPDGGEGVVKLPPITFSVDNTQKGKIVLKAFGLELGFELQDEGITLQFDGQSIMTRQSTIDLGKSKEHELIVRCS